jgi:hypothetical protein
MRVLLRLLVFVLSAMDGKIEQHVCIKFYVKVGKSTAETLEMLHEASGEHSSSQTQVFEWHSRGQVSGEDDKCSQWPSTSKMTENVEKFENSSIKTVAEQSISLQTPLGSVMEFARRSEQKI